MTSTSDPQPKQPVAFYVINLDRSRDRWTAIKSRADEVGIAIERVEAVDGRAVPQADWVDFDAARFRRRHGRPPKPGEYGCYASHMAAIRRFLASGHRSAVVLEDDARLNEKLGAAAAELDTKYGKVPVLVRLSSHRIPAFEAIDTIGDTHFAIGNCWFGPNGSSSAYWISRLAGERLVQSMVPGSCPYDMMQERSWETGVPFFQVNPNLLDRPDWKGSTIETPEARQTAYGKYPWYRRLPAYVFRTVQLTRRTIACARQRRIA